MDRLLKNLKTKESAKLPRQHISLGIPTNVAVGPVGFRAELDVGPKGEQRHSRRGLEVDRPDSTMMLDVKDTRAPRIVFIDRGGRSEGLPAPGTSTVGTMVGDDQHGDRPIGEHLRPLPL